MPWGEATPRPGRRGLTPASLQKAPRHARNPEEVLAFAATLSGLSCWVHLQAGSPIDRNHRPGNRTNLSARPVPGRRSLDRPGSEDPDPHPERRRVVVPSAVLSNRIEHLPCRSEPRPGPILPSMRPAFPWPHLPRGRVESFGATPKGDAFPSPSGAACPDPRTAATGFRPRFPGSVSRVTDRASSLGNKVNVPHRMGR
jgi:hypothetical protein